MRSRDSNSSAPYHSRFCALRNKKEALGFVLVSMLIAFLSWRDLGKPLINTQGLFTVLLGHLTALAVLLQLFLLLRCFRERLVLGLGMTSLTIGLGEDLLPGVLEPATTALRALALLIWVVALGVSVSMFASALKNREHHTEDSGNANQA